MSATATIFGSQGWLLYTGLTVFTYNKFLFREKGMTSDSWPDNMTLHFWGNEFKFEKLRKKT
jgi:hypothetical protein